MSQESRDEQGGGSEVRPGTYLAVGAVAMVAAFGILGGLVAFGDELVRSGLADTARYAFLVLLGIGSAALLFGFMRSTATGVFERSVLGVRLDISGPLVGAAMVVVGAYALIPRPTSTNLVVRVVSAGPAAQVVPGAEVSVDLGTLAFGPAVSDGQGRAVFNDLPSDRLAGEVVVTARAPGFDSRRQAFPPEARAPGTPLEITLDRGRLRITGTVLEGDGEQVAAGVILTFGGGMAVDTTDADGTFEVTVEAGAPSLIGVIGRRGAVVGLNTEVPSDPAAPLTLRFGT